MSAESRAMRDLKRQVAAELALRHGAGVSPAQRAQQHANRLVLVVSSVAALVAVWDLGLLLGVGPG